MLPVCCKNVLLQASFPWQVQVRNEGPDGSVLTSLMHIGPPDIVGVGAGVGASVGVGVGLWLWGLWLWGVCP